MRGFDDYSSEQNFFREFGPWTPWARRGTLEDGHNSKVQEYAGVYLLAHFADELPVGPASHLDEHIIYVGEGSLLRSRWGKFQASALRGVRGHSGGLSYHRTFNRSRWGELHVAALPIWFGQHPIRSAEDWTQIFRLYVERRILWEVTINRGGTHGLLNRK